MDLDKFFPLLKLEVPKVFLFKHDYEAEHEQSDSDSQENTLPRS